MQVTGEVMKTVASRGAAMSESAGAKTVSEGRAVEALQPADGHGHVHMRMHILRQTTELSQTLSYFKRSSMRTFQKVWRVMKHEE